jgi:hypothetical protein
METLVTVCIVGLVLLVLYGLSRRRPRDAVSVPDVGGPGVALFNDGGSGGDGGGEGPGGSG